MTRAEKRKRRDLLKNVMKKIKKDKPVTSDMVLRKLDDWKRKHFPIFKGTALTGENLWECFRDSDYCFIDTLFSLCGMDQISNDELIYDTGYYEKPAINVFCSKGKRETYNIEGRSPKEVFEVQDFLDPNRTINFHLCEDHLPINLGGKLSESAMFSLHDTLSDIFAKVFWEEKFWEGYGGLEKNRIDKEFQKQKKSFSKRTKYYKDLQKQLNKQIANNIKTIKRNEILMHDQIILSNIKHANNLRRNNFGTDEVPRLMNNPYNTRFDTVIGLCTKQLDELKSLKKLIGESAPENRRAYYTAFNKIRKEALKRCHPNKYYIENEINQNIAKTHYNNLTELIKEITQLIDNSDPIIEEKTMVPYQALQIQDKPFKLQVKPVTDLKAAINSLKTKSIKQTLILAYENNSLPETLNSDQTINEILRTNYEQLNANLAAQNDRNANMHGKYEVDISKQKSGLQFLKSKKSERESEIADAKKTGAIKADNSKRLRICIKYLIGDISATRIQKYLIASWKYAKYGLSKIKKIGIEDPYMYRIGFIEAARKYAKRKEEWETVKELEPSEQLQMLELMDYNDYNENKCTIGNYLGETQVCLPEDVISNIRNDENGKIIINFSCKTLNKTTPKFKISGKKQKHGQIYKIITADYKSNDNCQALIEFTGTLRAYYCHGSFDEDTSRHLCRDIQLQHMLSNDTKKLIVPIIYFNSEFEQRENKFNITWIQSDPISTWGFRNFGVEPPPFNDELGNNIITEYLRRPLHILNCFNKLPNSDYKTFVETIGVWWISTKWKQFLINLFQSLHEIHKRGYFFRNLSKNQIFYKGTLDGEWTFQFTDIHARNYIKVVKRWKRKSMFETAMEYITNEFADGNFLPDMFSNTNKGIVYALKIIYLSVNYIDIPNKYLLNIIDDYEPPVPEQQLAGTLL